MSDLNIYEQDNYKEVLKQKLLYLKASDKKYTLKYLAGQIEIQHTYLSKFFNKDEVNLSSDDVFELARSLNFTEDEIEYLLLLRELATTQNPEKHEYLRKRVKEYQLKYRVGKEMKLQTQTNNELEYLLNPNFLIIHIALTMSKFRKSPVDLCDPMGLTINELKSYIKTLVSLDFLEIGETPLEITNVKMKKLHYGKTHPLMRIHQQLLRGKVTERIANTSESNKESFMATFSFDEANSNKAKDEFKTFFNKVSDLQSKTKGEGLYQLNFDLFKWF